MGELCWPARSHHDSQACALKTLSGIQIDRSTLADWAGTAAFHLGPVVDWLTEHLKSSGKLFMDETTAPVLDPGRGRTKTGYLWALARDDRGWGGDAPPGVVFTYNPSRAGAHAEQILQGFDGILQLDGYTGYDRLTRPSRKGARRSRLRIIGPMRVAGIAKLFALLGSGRGLPCKFRRRCQA